MGTGKNAPTPATASAPGQLLPLPRMKEFKFFRKVIAEIYGNIGLALGDWRVGWLDGCRSPSFIAGVPRKCLLPAAVYFMGIMRMDPDWKTIRAVPK